ncbi:DUF4258 domain-containing protein [Rhodopseudomonas palustris]|uniref:DUF4258 domain-containing protein n=1 Tax=Rhodopseudomonas palustris TaxID=1076 RepID=UPI000641E76F
MKKPLIWTVHARVRSELRRIEHSWIEQTIYEPSWIEQDPADPTVERRFRAVSEFGGRILRVACVETNSDIRVISALFDHRARRKP